MAMCAIALAGMVGGCASTTGGHPVASAPSGTEPAFPTPRPSRTSAPPTTAPSTAPSPTHAPTATAAPPGGDRLTPQNGYVYIETKSGLTRCQISAADVGCESEFENSPTVDGFPANGVQLTASGQVRWIVGNLGDIPTVALDYKTYTALGWTIVASADGTRFTNDGTGHGMRVRIEGVEVF